VPGLRPTNIAIFEAAMKTIKAEFGS